jgi:3-oxoacyl-[acyl-carrier-protein] synthase II
MTERVVVSGIGIVCPGLFGREAVVRAFPTFGRPGSRGRLPDFALEDYLEGARPFRRVAGATKFALAAMALAVGDAGFAPGSFGGDRAGILVGITHGAAPYSVEFNRELRVEGPLAASPMHFAESVPNASAGNAAIAFQVHGPVHTLIGEESVGAQAIDLAAGLLRAGLLDRCLVAGTEEWSEVITHAYRQIDRATGRDKDPDKVTPMSEGAAALVLELEGAPARRAGAPRAVLSGWSLSHRRAGSMEDAVAAVACEACRQAGSAIAEVGHILPPTGRHRRAARRGLETARGDAPAPPIWVDLAPAIGNPVGAAHLVQVGVSAALLSAGTLKGPGLAVAAGIAGTLSAVVLSGANRERA